MIEVILCCVTGGQRYKDMYVDASIASESDGLETAITNYNHLE